MLVTFIYTKQSSTADITVTFTSGATQFSFGPNTGATTLDLLPGAQYTLSVSSAGPGGAAFNSVTNSSSIGVDDRQGISDSYQYLDRSSQGWYLNGTNTGPSYAIYFGGALLASGGGSGPSVITSGQFQYRIGSLIQGQCFFPPQGTGCFYTYYTDRYIFVPGADFDYNDFTISASVGTFTGTTFTVPWDPTITSFVANPNPQTSGLDGIPNYDTSLLWQITNGSGVYTYQVNPGNYTGTTSNSGGITVNNLPQSIVGSNSPSTTSYTLLITETSTAGSFTPETDTASLTVSAYNDNTPNNYTVPDQTNLEPSTLTTIIFGPISGIDMRTSVTAGPGAEVSNNNINWSNSVLIQNNQTCYVRAFSPPFNTDPNGLTNSSTFSVTVGTVQKFFTITTRAPDVNETFNLSDKEDYVPTPDIDTIPDPDAAINNQANPYIVSDTLLIDDVELANPNGVEIKVDKPDVQVRIKRSGQSTFGPWEDVRSI